MRTKKPTPTQLKALRRMLAADGTVRRINGGFWMSGEVSKNNYPGLMHIPIDKKCDDYWCDIRTVRAMENAGWVERTNKFPEEWRDMRRITPAGREASGG